MINEMPLVGDDGQIFTGTKGAFYEGDGAKTLHQHVGGMSARSGGEGMYVIEGVAKNGSVLPKGLNIGELYPALGTEVLATGDKLVRLDLTHVADCTGWELQISQSEIDVTRLCDRFKKYRLGKKDATGTVNSIMTLGVSDGENGIIARTIKLFRRSAQGSVTVTDIDNTPIFFLGYVRKTDVSGETQAFVFGQVYLYNMKLGGSTGSAQSYDSSMRLTGQDPVFYSIENP